LAYKNHGLNDSALSWVLIREVESNSIHAAEAAAIRIFASAFRRIASEVFACPSKEVARSVLMFASKTRVPFINTPAKEFNKQDIVATDWQGIPLSKNPVEDATDFVLSSECGSEDQMLEAFDLLPMNVAELIPHLFMVSAVLIGRGLSYNERKPLIQQYAMGWRTARIPLLEAA
jgi:hypothetical protein